MKRTLLPSLDDPDLPSAVPLQDEESIGGDEEPLRYVADGVRPAHNGAMRRKRSVDDERLPDVELDRFIDPSELWP